MKISFIGHGNMAKAMITGIIKSKLISKTDIYISDCDKNNQAAVDFADYIFLTVKPNIYKHVVSNLVWTKNKVFITVAPGIKTTFIDAKVIRTMPNTPALVGEGVTSVCRGKDITNQEFNFVKKLLATFSVVYEFEESLMDYTIALSGSSPAYLYMFIEAMANYGKKHGINYETAKNMAAQTLLGSAKMILASEDTPETLCAKVCTKGGATIKAVETFRNLDFEATIIQAMEACCSRAFEMADEFDKEMS
ncbi:MAG: pyrroline-5-carboxylate reductase [Erysipelotrichales bacterium]|nr:pyrroline-5-carboxylate reductase [Erysipelotrichales bacterium]